MDILEEYCKYKGISLNESKHWIQYRIYPYDICKWHVEYRIWPFFWIDLAQEYFSFRQKAEAWFKDYLFKQNYLKKIQEKNKHPISNENLLELNKENFNEELS